MHNREDKWRCQTTRKNLTNGLFSRILVVRYISRHMTLNEGDIIATGTPSGVSKLESGDICEIEIEGIGKLTNPVLKAV